jgi:hypothetical protein
MNGPGIGMMSRSQTVSTGSLSADACAVGGGLSLLREFVGATAERAGLGPFLAVFFTIGYAPRAKPHKLWAFTCDAPTLRGPPRSFEVAGGKLSFA